MATTKNVLEVCCVRVCASNCQAPGAENAPCLGGYRGTCVRGSASNAFSHMDANLHLCSEPGLVCSMQNSGDVNAANAMVREDASRHTGKTTGNELVQGVLPLDAQFTPRSSEEDELASRIVGTAERYVRRFNGNTCPGEGQCPQNECNRVAKEKEREFLSNSQCSFLSETMGPFGVVNPWCAAFVDVILRQWKADNLRGSNGGPRVDETFELPEHVAVRFWRDWAFCHGHEVVPIRNLGPNDIRAGDLVIKSTSHIGIATGKTRVWDGHADSWAVESLDGNTLRNGVPCDRMTNMPGAHVAGQYDASRNSGWAQYACRSNKDYNVVIRLRGLTPGAGYKQRCWGQLQDMCDKNSYNKCQNLGNPELNKNGKIKAFCAHTSFWSQQGGCPNGLRGQSGLCYGQGNRCCLPSN
jgi:hypothetical protein